MIVCSRYTHNASRKADRKRYIGNRKNGQDPLTVEIFKFDDIIYGLELDRR